MGINARSTHQAAAKTFLEWVATPEFASLYSNALPGFFTLQNTSVKLDDPLAQTFVSWRKICQSTMRDSYQILSRGTPNLENQLWNVSAQVLNGTMTPQAAAAEVQKGLDSWYKPVTN
jgi:raffinose/stachyose/melibiose transport system substrate-binding protein